MALVETIAATVVAATVFIDDRRATGGGPHRPGSWRLVSDQRLVAVPLVRGRRHAVVARPRPRRVRAYDAVGPAVDNGTGRVAQIAFLVDTYRSPGGIGRHDLGV